MGWNSWNAFQTAIDEKKIRGVADALVDSGMQAAGYRYVVVDAGWKAKDRDAQGRLQADPERFPSGMKALGDYLHGKGLLFGIYTDAGTKDCVSGAPGSHEHEMADAETFASWGVDYVKEDWCSSEGIDARDAYTRMSQALASTGRPIVFSLCEWGDHQPWMWASGVADLWRTTGDDKDCWDCGRETATKIGGYPRGWTLILDAQPALAQYAGPGHWNDPDMLEVGLPGLSEEESRAQFSLWAILAAPLMASNDLRSMSPQVRSIFANRDVIGVDQDLAGREGIRVGAAGKLEVWRKSLADGSRAVVLFNRSLKRARMHLSAVQAGLQADQPWRARDLWGGGTATMESGKSFASEVPAHGVVMLRVTSASAATTNTRDLAHAVSKGVDR